MPNLNLTFLNAVIDRSGSMAGLVQDTVGGFNKFLDEQKKADGEALMSITYFDQDIYMPVDSLNIKDVREITPKGYFEGGGGGTALYDAIGMAVETCKARIASMPEDQRPGKVIFMIITDGQENSSQKFNSERVKGMVTMMQNEDKWSFLFMGANIDSFEVGDQMGFAPGMVANYSASSGGTSNAYGAVSANVASSRGIRSRGVARGMSADSMEVESVGLLSYSEKARKDLMSDVAVSVSSTSDKDVK